MILNKKIWSLSLLLILIFSLSSFGRLNVYTELTEISSLHYITGTKQSRVNLIEFSHLYLGTSYKEGSTGPNSFDCSGFTSYVFSKHGINLNRSSVDQAKQGKRIPISSAQPGDLVFFTNNENISHVGIIIKNEKYELLMIHSSSFKGITVENITKSSYWSNKLFLVKDVFSEINLNHHIKSAPESF